MDVGSEPMMDAFEITNHRDHRQGSFHTHALIPGAFDAQLTVVGNVLGTAEAVVSQHNALV